MDVFTFYIEWFYFELKRRESISRLLNIPLTLLIATGALYSFLFAFATANISEPFIVILLILVFASTFFYVKAARLLLVAFLQQEEYWLLSNPSHLLNDYLDGDTKYIEAPPLINDIARGIEENKSINDFRETKVAEFYIQISSGYLLLAVCHCLYIIWLFLNFFSINRP